MPLAEAVQSYIDNVLRHRRDEATLIDPPTGAITMPTDLVGVDKSGTDTVETDAEDWRKYV